MRWAARAVGIASAALACGALAVGLEACPTTTTTSSYTPITGILIRSASLVAGHGCGMGSGEVYRYGALVSYTVDGVPTGTPQWSGVFDCFTDGLFENLITDASNQGYFVQIAAWDYAGFPSDLACSNAASGCPGENVTTVSNDAPSAQWSTTCTATPQQGITVLAVCGPLVGAPVDAGGDADADAESGLTQILIPTQSFPRADGGTVTCGIEYDSDDAFFTDGIGSSMTGMQSCSMPLLISPAKPGAMYKINLYLVQSDAGAVVEQTMCTATATPNTTTTATCGSVSPPSGPGDAGEAGSDGGSNDASSDTQADASTDAADATID
jgi:hypothetical protein